LRNFGKSAPERIMESITVKFPDAELLPNVEVPYHTRRETITPFVAVMFAASPSAKVDNEIGTSKSTCEDSEF
jgi:hypothetical protein